MFFEIRSKIKEKERKKDRWTCAFLHSLQLLLEKSLAMLPSTEHLCIHTYSTHACIDLLSSHIVTHVCIIYMHESMYVRRSFKCEYIWMCKQSIYVQVPSVSKCICKQSIHLIPLFSFFSPFNNSLL